MAVYQREYVPLQVVGADDKYLTKLLAYAQEVQPVTRYRCPRGFTSSPKKFPDEPKSLRRHGLWFVDREGRACAPTKGATLSNKDYLTREVRKLVDSGVDDAKLSQCVSDLESKKPSAAKSRSLNASKDKLSTLMNSVEEDKGIFARGLAGQMGGARGEAAEGGVELGGGYKLPEKSLESIRTKFEKLSPEKQDDLIAECQETVEKLEDKDAEAHKRQLECLFEKHPVLRELAPPAAGGTEDFRAISSFCASMTSGSDCDNSECESSAVSGSTRCNPKYLGEFRRTYVKEKKQAKLLYKHLNAVFRKYHNKVTRCTTRLTADEERKYLDKVETAYTKYDGASKNNPTVATTKATTFFASMRECAAAYGQPDAPPSGVKSPVAGSKVYIPRALVRLKQNYADLKTNQKAEADLSAWWSQFYARQQRLHI